MRINHNISSMVTQGSLHRINQNTNKTLEKLSTGLRINRASDDAAGLSVSEQLRTQVNGLNMAKRNAQDGIALLQVAEGAANETSDMLQRMRELAVQSANDTLTSTERGYINQEYLALQSEIDRVTESTQYNTQQLINDTGTAGRFGVAGNQTLQVGANDSTNDVITIDIDGIDTASMGVDSVSSNLSTQSDANAAITLLDTAIDSVNNMRSDLGAYVNRLEHTVNNLINQEYNTQSAESLIRDADFANETSEFTKYQILQQSASSMLVQSNMKAQSVLSLLG
ncbi:MAG: flagellin [Fibrobacterota bacterium]